MNVGLCWRRVDLEHEGGRSAGAAKGPMSWNQANKTPVKARPFDPEIGSVRHVSLHVRG